MKKLLLTAGIFCLSVNAYAVDYSDDFFAKNFKSPSGNIVCMGDSIDDEDVSPKYKSGVSCYIFKRTNNFKLTQDEKDCGLDWTDGYSVFKTGKAEYDGACHGDIFWNMQSPVLQYGQTIKGNGWQCTSLTTGMKCTNTKGSGFQIGKTAQKVW